MEEAPLAAAEALPAGTEAVEEQEPPPVSAAEPKAGLSEAGTAAVSSDVEADVQALEPAHTEAMITAAEAEADALSAEAAETNAVGKAQDAEAQAALAEAEAEAAELELKRIQESMRYEEDAAAKVQAIHRGQSVRRQAAAAKLELQRIQESMRNEAAAAAKVQAIHRGQSVRRRAALLREQATLVDAADSGAADGSVGDAANRLAEMAEMLEHKITERDAIVAELQAEPPGDVDAEAALSIAVQLVARHGELEAQIEQLEAELTSQTEELTAALDSAGGGDGEDGGGDAPPDAYATAQADVDELKPRQARVSFAPKLSSSDTVPEPESDAAPPSKNEANADGCAVQ